MMQTQTEIPTRSPGLAACAVGINPIMWSNDDFQELGEGTSLDRCLAEMAEAGYAGSELGHKYPRTSPELGAALGRHGLRLVSGWHSTYLAERDLAGERASFRAHLDLLHSLKATVVIVAECSRRIYDQPTTPLGWTDDRPRLDEAGWSLMVAGLQEFSALTAAAGMKLVYHHHLGTVIQTGDELDRLMAEAPAVGLLLDPGHLAFAGLDPLAVLNRYGARVGHVHLKNVRPDVVRRARAERWSFRRAVVEGAFTIPGDGAPPRDGSVDFPSIFQRLADYAYTGWLVVEAEEDPGRASAPDKARRARAYVRRHTSA